MRGVAAVRIRLYLKIFCEDVEGVEVLALILVQPLYLNVKYRGRVERYARPALGEGGEILLVGCLYLTQV